MFRVGGLPLGVIVLLAALCLLSLGSLGIAVASARNTWVFRSDTRKREGELWKLDHEEQFAALRRQFLQLADDVASDLGRAVDERERAGAANARAGKREKRTAASMGVEQGARTRDVVRRERLGSIVAVGGTE